MTLSYDKPWLSVVCTTIGRGLLGRLLDSIPPNNGIEIIVVADTYANDEADFTEGIAKEKSLYKDRVTWYDYDAGYHCYGHPQRQYGDSMATGDWIVHSQDDNQFHPSAFTDIWFAICAQTHPYPILFKVYTWQAGTVWKDPELRLENVDADCLVAPNNPTKLGSWGSRYQGDYDMIFETIKLYDFEVDFNPALISWHAGKDDYSVPKFRAK